MVDSENPGMKVLQFAFDPSGESVYLPHRYSENCVVYTGTHDNDTTRGWYRTLDKESRDFAKEYMGVSRLDDDTLTWDFMRLAMGSAAQLCVTPIQDILGIDGSGRINMPSTLGGNWTWQMEKGAFDKIEQERIKDQKRIEQERAEKIEGSGDRESIVKQSRFLIFLYVSNRQKVC